METSSGAPLALEGEVGSWTLQTLSFDPARPGAARVDATLDMASLTTGRAGYDRDMTTEEWLSVDRFPTATFTARGAQRLDRDTFALAGTLQLRGHTVDLPVEFSLAGHENGSVTVQGHARLDRRDFGIGTGARDGLVERGVDVTFRFTAVPDGGQKEESGQ